MVRKDFPCRPRLRDGPAPPNPRADEHLGGSQSRKTALESPLVRASSFLEGPRRRRRWPSRGVAEDGSGRRHLA
jgi:hypothetical protein